MRNTILCLVIGTLGLAILGCGPTADDAIELLQAEGLTDIEVEQEPDGSGVFTFKATDTGGKECLGSASINKQGMKTTTSVSKICQWPAGPVTEALPEGADSEADRRARLCDKGEMVVCSDLGYSFLKGEGVAHDEDRAVELFRMACEGDSGQGCKNLAVAYCQGLSVEKSRGLCREHNERGCVLGEPVCCNDAGLLYRDPAAGEGDPAKVTEYLQRGCDLGYAVSCRHLGANYWYAKGVQRDRDKARELFRKACDGGDEMGCRNVEEAGG